MFRRETDNVITIRWPTLDAPRRDDRAHAWRSENGALRTTGCNNVGAASVSSVGPVDRCGGGYACVDGGGANKTTIRRRHTGGRNARREGNQGNTVAAAPNASGTAPIVTVRHSGDEDSSQMPLRPSSQCTCARTGVTSVAPTPNAKIRPFNHVHTVSPTKFSDLHQICQNFANWLIQ